MVGVSDDMVPLLREAVDRAVLDVGEGGTYWFVHPLLAEVLETGLLPEERATLHAAFAARVGARGEVRTRWASSQSSTSPTTTTGPDTGQGIPLGAARPPTPPTKQAAPPKCCDCYAGPWTCGRRCPNPDVSRIDLLQRIRAAAERPGEQEQELAAVEDLLAIVDSDVEPLLATELLVRRD